MAFWQIPPRRFPRPLRAVTDKELHLWVGAWLMDRARRLAEATPKGPRHLLFAVCDHFEPLNGEVSIEAGKERVLAWRTRYPEVAKRFVDAAGRGPRHSFFFPGEQYEPSFVEPLAELCEQGHAEVELHLHHEDDTRASLHAILRRSLFELGSHGIVPQKNGAPAWAFIHGNWCLSNGRRDGRMCGVDDELILLHQLGCYADFTFPSAPDESQPGIVNAIYYPRGDLSRRRAYEDGEPVRVGQKREDRILLIEGPLAIARRPGSPRIRIESSAIDFSDPPTAARLATWVGQGIGVLGKSDWVFVKVHTHGAPEKNAEVMLGEHALRFHEALRDAYNDGEDWKLYYVTAREMYNLARAAMDGMTGSPEAYFDYEIPRPPRAVR